MAENNNSMIEKVAKTDQSIAQPTPLPSKDITTYWSGQA